VSTLVRPLSLGAMVGLLVVLFAVALLGAAVPVRERECGLIEPTLQHDDMAGVDGLRASNRATVQLAALLLPAQRGTQDERHLGGRVEARLGQSDAALCGLEPNLDDLQVGQGLPAPWTGGSTGCVLPDPTGTGGCVTGSTWHLLEQVAAAWGAWPGSCWDAHAWNPRSDHPRGLACDFTVGRLGRRPSAQERARGWGLAEWLLAGADRLAVRYVIFDGLYCPAGGACRPYSGGGVYDPESVTGGHFDHVHVSLRDGSGTA
jgi:hypothetical protein